MGGKREIERGRTGKVRVEETRGEAGREAGREGWNSFEVSPQHAHQAS